MTASTKFPLTKTVGWFKARDHINGFGDTVPGFPDTPVELNVFGWYVTGGLDTDAHGNTFQVSWDIVLFAPVEAGISSLDRIDIPQVGVCEIVQTPADWSHNPWWNSGLAEVRLRRIDSE